MGTISDICSQHHSGPHFDRNQRHGRGDPPSPNGGRSAGAGNADDLLGGSDGQHYSKSYYAPGTDSGQRSVISRAGRVGHDSGGEQQMRVPSVKTSVMTEHE